MSYYWERQGVHYDTLYGYAPTKAEWEAEQAYRKAKGWFQENEYGTPWHCGWQRHADGGADISGEWQFYGSYTCKKIIRPSYDQNSTVKLCVRVGGKYKNQFSKFNKPRHRYNRWSASIEFGGFSTSFYDRKYGTSCHSVAEACRKAEALPFLDEEVKKLLHRAYSQRTASSVYREVNGEYVPWRTDFEQWGRPDWWPVGVYFKTHWERPWRGPEKGQWVLAGTHYKCTGGGYCSGTYDEPGIGYIHGDKQNLIHKAMVETTGSWLPQPAGDV